MTKTALRPWPAVQRLAALVLVVSGCIAPTLPDARPEADGAPAWNADDWWTYDTGDGSLTLVFDGASLLITDHRVGRELATARTPLLAGEFRNGTWAGAFLQMVTFESAKTDATFTWVPGPPQANATADADDRSIRNTPQSGDVTVTAVDAERVYIRYSGVVDGTATYDREPRFFDELRLSRPVHIDWTLLDHGHLWHDTAWLVEQRDQAQTVLAVLSCDLETNGANVMQVDVRTACTVPGAYDLLLGPGRPSQGEYVWAQLFVPTPRTTHTSWQGHSTPRSASRSPVAVVTAA